MAPSPLFLCLLVIGMSGYITNIDHSQNFENQRFDRRISKERNDFQKSDFINSQQTFIDGDNLDDIDNFEQEDPPYAQNQKCHNFKNTRQRLDCLAKVVSEHAQGNQVQNQAPGESSSDSLQQNENDDISSWLDKDNPQYKQSDRRSFEQQENSNDDNRKDVNDKFQDRKDENKENSKRGNQESQRRNEQGRNDAELERTININSDSVPGYCHLSAHTGRCKANIKRYFYYPSEHKCKLFVYGGCDTNGNNFRTIETCQRTCQREVCDRPKYPGHCEAYIPRYYYDIDTSTCKQFIYGGCQSNGNNFVSNDECYSVCGDVVASKNEGEEDKDNIRRPFNNNINANNDDDDSARNGKVQQNGDRLPQCSTSCKRSHEKFNMKKGVTYKYHYEANIDTSISERITGESIQEHPVSGHKISIDAEVQVIDDCEMELKIKRADVKGKQSFQKISNINNDDRNHEIVEDLKRHPLRFSFEDGKIDHVCSRREENAVVVDIKKGILSLVQNTMTDLQQENEKTYEGDMSGVCPTIYQSKKSNEQSDITEIQKTKDLSKCDNKVYDEESLSYVPTISDTINERRSVFLANGAKECLQKITKDKLLKSSDCMEKFVFQAPHSSTSNKDAPFINVKTSQHLTLTGIGQSSQQEHQDQKMDFVRSGLSSYVHRPGVQDAKNGNPQNILEQLERLGESIVEGVTVDTPESFLALVTNVRSLSKESIVDIFNKLHDRSRRSSDNQSKDAKSYKFYIDAIPMASTLESVQAMVEIIKSQRLSISHTKFWVISLSFISNPEIEMVNALEPLVDLLQNNHDILLAMTSLIHNLAQARPNYQDLNQIPTARKVQKIITHSLRSSCGEASSNPEQNKQTLYALKALGNMGHSPNLVPEVLKCFQNQNVPREVKSAAVESFRRMPCEAHRELMDLFGNGNDVEVRIKAFFLIHKCPNLQSMKELKQTLQNEANKDVLTMAYTFYQNLEESSDPDKETVKYMAAEVGIADAIRDQATKYIIRASSQINAPDDDEESNKDEVNGSKNKNPLRKSQISNYFESSLYSETFSTGIISEGHVLYDRSLPRSATYNLTLDLFGLNFNIFEIALQLEMTDYLSDASYSSDNFKKLQQQSFLINLLQQSNQEANQQSNNQKRSYLPQEDEQKEQQRTDQDNHIFNAFDKYVGGGDYSDFSNLASGIVQFVSDPRFEKLRALSSIKIQGNEIAFLDIFGKDVKEILANPFALLEKLAKLSKPQKKSITESILLFDSTTLIQTSVGIPLNVTIRSAVVSNIEMEGKMDFSKILTSTHDLSLIGQIKPSASKKTHISLSLSGVSKSGIGISSVIHTNTKLTGEMHVGLDGLRTKLVLPEEKQEIVTTRNEFFLISNNGEKILDEHGVKNHKCSGDRLNKILGIKVCLETVHPSAISKVSHKNIPTGILATKITIEKGDSSIKYHDINIRTSKRNQSSYDIKASINTPGSSINRQLTVQGVLDSNRKSLQVNAQGANDRWQIDGKINHVSQDKTSAWLNIQTNNKDIHKFLTSYEKTYDYKETRKSKFFTYDYIDPDRKNTYFKFNISYTAAPDIEDMQEQTQETDKPDFDEMKVTYWGQLNIPDSMSTNIDGITKYTSKYCDIIFNSEYTPSNKEIERLNLKKYVYYDRKNFDHTFKYVSNLKSTQFPNLEHDISIYSDLKTKDESRTLKKGIYSTYIGANVSMSTDSWVILALSASNKTVDASELKLSIESDHSSGRKVTGTGIYKSEDEENRNNKDELTVARLKMDVKYDARRRPDRRIKLYFGMDKVSDLEFYTDGQIDIFPKTDFQTGLTEKRNLDDSLYARYVLAINRTSSLKALIDYDFGEGKQYYNLEAENSDREDKTHDMSIKVEQLSSKDAEPNDRDKELNIMTASLYIAEHDSQAKVDLNIKGSDEDYKLMIRHKGWSRSNDQGLSTQITASSSLWYVRNIDMVMNITVRNNQVDGKLKLTHNEHKLIAYADGTLQSQKSLNIQVNANSSLEHMKSVTINVRGEKINSKWSQKYEAVWREQNNDEHDMTLDLVFQLQPHLATQIQIQSSTTKNIIVDIRISFEPNLHLLIRTAYYGNNFFIKTVYPEALPEVKDNDFRSQWIDLNLPALLETNIKLVVNEFTLQLGLTFTNLQNGLSVNWNTLITPMMTRPVEIDFKTRRDEHFNSSLKVQLSQSTLLATLQHEKRKDKKGRDYFLNNIEIYPDLEADSKHVIKIDTMASVVAASTNNQLTDKRSQNQYNISTRIRDTNLDTLWNIQTLLDFNRDSQLVNIDSKFFLTEDKIFGIQLQMVDRSRLHSSNVTWLFRIYKTDTKLDWTIASLYTTSQNGWVKLNITSNYMMNDGRSRSIEIRYSQDFQSGLHIASIDMPDPDMNIHVVINNRRPHLMATLHTGDLNSTKGSAIVITLNTDTNSFNMKFGESIHVRASVDTDTRITAEIYNLESEHGQRQQLQIENSNYKESNEYTLPALTAAAILNDSHHLHFHSKWSHDEIGKIVDILANSGRKLSRVITTGIQHLNDDLRSKIGIDESINGDGIHGIYQTLKQFKQYINSAYNEDNHNEDEGQAKQNLKRHSQVRQKLNKNEYKHISSSKGPLNDLVQFISNMTNEMVSMSHNIKRAVLSSKAMRYRAEHILHTMKNSVQTMSSNIYRLAQVIKNYRYKLKNFNLMSNSGGASNLKSMSQNLLGRLSPSSQIQSQLSNGKGWGLNLLLQALGLTGLKHSEDIENNMDIQQQLKEYNSSFREQLQFDASGIVKYLKYVIPDSELISLPWPKMTLTGGEDVDLQIDIVLPFAWNSFNFPPDMKATSELRSFLNIIRDIKSSLGFSYASKSYSNWGHAFKNAALEYTNVAALINGSHILTWDKQVYPLAPFTCKYILAKDKSDQKGWIISASHNTDNALIIYITHKGKQIQLGPGPKVLVDNSPVGMPRTHENFEISRYPDDIIFHTQRNDLLLKYHPDSNSLLVAVSKAYDNDVVGVLGTNDNDPDNEFTNPNGEIFINIQDLEPDRSTSKGRPNTNFQRFMSLWKNSQQCQENVDLQQNTLETLGQASSSDIQKHRSVANYFIRANAIRKCHPKYSQKTVKSLFDQLSAHDPQQAVCSLAWTIAQECSLKDINIATPRACGVCHSPEDMKAFTHDLNLDESITLTTTQLSDARNSVYIVYIVEESDFVKDIEAEIMLLTTKTNVEIRRRHPNMDIIYSVVGFGNDNFGATIRFYTPISGSLTFYFDLLHSILKTLMVNRRTRPVAVDAIFETIQRIQVNPSSIKIMHLITSSRTQVDRTPPIIVQRLLEQTGITLHALIPCSLVSQDGRSVLGVDQLAAYTLINSLEDPVVGDQSLRHIVTVCNDAIAPLAQSSRQGTLFDENVLHFSDAPPKSALLTLQSRLLAQNARQTCQHCQCTNNVYNVAKIMCSSCDSSGARNRLTKSIKRITK